ncbi:hypothetical protein FHR81_003652 [Actinoalloteichus hoggarensis]|uniref:Uncharacterized protein n=1 Tax=Actinoalloteichus hoggarensis TaxID=1470176 RepID=A0A221WAD8_9PSEU|nr:hypothetical protein [Actinoalloteichus hoggarensis]ASO22990.1 hypothetical protein AHOG_26960 [Actinoalloteichus hoggarensis]MBB5922595.1 hypothetical protein [Actinoalloteichus hoggarensis]
MGDSYEVDPELLPQAIADLEEALFQLDQLRFDADQHGNKRVAA